ncbi:MAG: chemotaxis protein CheD [Candidatus Firestonebacteria bacterium]|nr:chemotaxis protein CheD [Candidatus Firestonebacteria bacterium]
MHHLAKISEMCVSKNPEDTLGAFGLGSCLAIILYDPQLRAGGILHSLLPRLSNVRKESLPRQEQPLMFVDQGLPLLFKQVKALGAEPKHIEVYVVGGATFTNDENDLFAIGLRNFVTACETLRRLKLPLTAKEVGGRISRTVRLHVATGRIVVQSGGKEHELCK